jgi:hypothetical protein
MQVHLHHDTHTEGSHLMAEHVQTLVQAALGRFGERITRVEVHLAEADIDTKVRTHGIHCTLEARLVGLDAVVVKDLAGNAHQAMEGALRKLKRAVGAVLSRHDPRNQRAGLAVIAERVADDRVD